MAKLPSEILDRQVIQLFRTSGNNEHVSVVLPQSAASGEIAIQLTEDASGTSLWTLAKDGTTPVQFVNKETIDYLISQGPSAQVTELSGATVALSGETVRIDTELQGLSSHTLSEIERIDESISAVSGYVVDYVKEVSGNIETTINAVSGNIETTINALSAGTEAAISELSGNVHSTIDAMDKSASAEAGKVVTTISQENGLVDETKTNLVDIALCGYTKTSATGAIADGDSLKDALSKLENVAGVNAIANADGSINVTTASTGTDINVNIKSGENVLAKDGDAGLYTDIDLVKITTGLPETVKERYQLLATDDSQIGANIDIHKDSHIVSITYITDPADEHYQNLEYVYIDASGVTQTTYVDMSELVLETEFASGVTVTDHVAHGVVDGQSEAFLTVGADGFKLSGVQSAIDTAQQASSAYTDSKIEALDLTGDTAVAGQYVAAIEETDGVVAVKTRANVSEAVLNNYSKGSDATAVAATDTVNQAIGKLENQIDAAKAAATTKVVEGTDTGNNMSIASGTGADGSVTYTINLSDVASAQDLSDLSAATVAEIARAKSAETAIDGAVGLSKGSSDETRTWSADGTYLTGSTVKADMESLDAIIGSGASSAFSPANTVAKNIDDIKADLEALKNKLALSGRENAYAKVTVVSADTGTTIEVSAKTQVVSAATAVEQGLADAYDVRTFAVSAVDTTSLATSAGVQVKSLGYDKVLDFTNLKVDCGEF